MRSLWCALVAICLVAGGLRVADGDHARPGGGELYAAKTAVVAHAVRRAASPQRRLVPVVAVAAARGLAPVGAVTDLSAAAVAGVAGVRSPFVRSSRGPPAA
ncbi:MAG: hypothetical protein ACM31C_06230 [Acidobacteriota bacterium]